jgi:hypothetical protein
MKIPCQMVDCTLLVAWRNWYARNEITHDKPLPPTEGSRRFLQSYLRTLREIKDMSTEHILKGKLPLIYSSFQAPRTLVKVSPPDKPWLKPPAGWVKLTIDGSFRAEDGNAGLGMVLRDEEGDIIFSASEFVQSWGEALEAELLACSVGLDLALQHSTLPIVILTARSLCRWSEMILRTVLLIFI